MNKSSNHAADFPNTEPMLPPGEEHSYAETSPAPLEAAPARPAIQELSLELAPIGGGEDDLLREVRKDGRVCPQPTRWLEFYRVLQDARPGAPLPAQPITGSAWSSTPPNAKRAAFNEQVDWAVKNGCTAQASEFLGGLPQSDWYYGG